MSAHRSGGDPDDNGASPGADEQRRRLRPRRWHLAAIAGLLLVAVAFACWLGFEALHAKSNLERARQNAQQAKEALLRGDVEDATKSVTGALADAQGARDATHSLPWRIAAVVPWLGGPFEAGQQISDVVLGLVDDVLQPAVHVGQAISPDRLLEGGHIDVQLLREAAPQLSQISTAAANLDVQAKAISDPHYLSVMRTARTDLQAQTSDLAKLLDHTAVAARLAPSMMGADGPRTYFMGFQTNAEARGTGGLLGAFGILRFDNGTPTVETLGQNNELNKPFAPIDLGRDYTDQYGFNDPTTDWRTSNLSPHFPYTAQIWKSMWEQQSGTTVDGVIAIDPVALSYILAATGPVTMPDGETITADNVVELTESTAYTRFADDNGARKQYLQDIAGEVVRKMTEPVSSPRLLLEALGKAVSQGRIAVWSSSPPEQQILEETPLGHTVPEDASPYAAVVINNLGGNKLDYYLTRQIEYTAAACDGATRNSSVTVRLTNKVSPGGLPDYVAANNEIPVDVPHGTNLAWVSLLATKNAKLTKATVNGEPLTIVNGAERGHPIYNAQVAIEPGSSIELRYELNEPTASGLARVPIQPLVDSVTPKVEVPACP
ncbi:DUF4012 domain-containing protein [Mycolicibacterium moriokaense]|nr:DUF4012 domain-containing protein [Mycolicibacterium moriokaense]